ncbi:hypothetical protein P7228_13665 [Altererythrobacter arenosus]|uniref:DUF4386 family protein n=1 Tax=Altererythrobacter arenosus TaxID=3032592 RepID=A0ABY8FPV2_9SPHN|nr:hypothetical protein [Altererythrobacter sp. CAU 1644]WFL77025.1 hypothetical protein P7228_13665 [Altererythrobacter sp. CAU 1644]
MSKLIGRLGTPGATLLFFALTIAILLVMRDYFPAELAIPLEGSDIRPVLLLEFASKPEHLINIFGEPGDPARADRIAGMNTGNALDYLLMPAYGLLTLSFFFGVARELADRRWRFFGWLAVIAAVSDAVENAIMFSMVADMSNAMPEMALLPYPVWLKFGLLALTCGAAVAAFAKLKRWILALLCVPAPLLLVPGMLDPFGLAPMATSMIGLGWAAMAIHAATRWIAHSRKPV